jgi:hypothetical protein
MTHSTDRSTPRWQLWLIGIIGGLAVAVLAFLTGGDDPDATREMASGIGSWSVRLLLVGVILAGGWGVLRSKESK